jgi:hypothetical protein
MNIDYNILAEKVFNLSVGENHKCHLAMQLADALRIVDGEFIPAAFIEKATGKPYQYQSMNLPWLKD